MGVLFVPQVLFERGEPWWNEVDGGKLLIRPHELSSNPASRVVWQQAGGMGEGKDEFGLVKYFYLYLQVIFYVP
jgi:hypothetical protein